MNDRVPSISIDDLKCKCGCNKNGTTVEWYTTVELLFLLMGFGPERIRSSYRCLKHEKTSKGSGKNHPMGFATDVEVHQGPELKKFLFQVNGLEIRRILLYPYKGFVHLDNNPDLRETLNYEGLK